MVGTIGARTTVGLISALTGPNDVEVQTETGARALRRLDPWTAFNVARLKRKVAANAEVGVLAIGDQPLRDRTAGRQRDALPADQRMPGDDGRCTNDAYVFSTDGRWRSAARDVRRRLAGGRRPRCRTAPTATSPTARTSFRDRSRAGGSLYVGKDGGAHWLWSAWQHVAGSMLEFNDVGYLERKNDYQANLTLATERSSRGGSRARPGPACRLNLRETLEGLNLWREIRARELAHLHQLLVRTISTFTRRDNYFDDRETGDGTALERTASLGRVAARSRTDPRRPLTVWLSSSSIVRRGDGVIFGLNGQISLRALSRLELALLPSAGYESGAPRYVSKVAPLPPTAMMPPADMIYHFGTQTAASVGRHAARRLHVHARAVAAVYTQLFLARVHYGPLLHRDAAGRRAGPRLDAA